MSDALAWLIVAGAFVLFIGGIVGVGYAWNTFTCDSRWSESQMNSKFTFMNGCMLEVSPGKWIPENRYREIPQ